MNHICRIYPFEVFDWKTNEEGLEIITTEGNFQLTTMEAGDLLERMEHGTFRRKAKEIEFKRLDPWLKKWVTVAVDPIDYIMDYLELSDLNWWIDEKLKKQL